MRGIFVTGTDTDAGKTLVSAALMTGAPADWRYWKPVQTGLATDVGDTATVARLAELSPERAPDVGVRLQPPVSPHHAAALRGGSIETSSLQTQASHLANDRHGGFWVVEGAGGILTPLSSTETMRDLAIALDLPVLVVVRVRLGAINHALLTAAALGQAGVRALGFLLSGDADPSLESALAAHATLPVLGRLPHCPPETPLGEHGGRLRHAILEALR